ncbi:MAG: DUF2182 domain-containing protein [Albidovulum sp.]
MTQPALKIRQIARWNVAGYGLWVGFYLFILLAWIGVALMARPTPGADISDIPAAFWDALCLSAAQANPLALWAMWALMAAAMMLPTFVPALATYSDMAGAGAASVTSAVMLVLGYLGIWLIASGFGATAQAGLAHAGLVAPNGQSLSRWLTALLLFGAGAYQFSPLKDACLARCRMPLTFFMQHWHPGTGPAFGMGARLGLVCLGCCWALMALGFVGGTMNLVWMGAATIFMALEKLPDIGRYLTRPAGAVLLMAGAATLLKPVMMN